MYRNYVTSNRYSNRDGGEYKMKNETTWAYTDGTLSGILLVKYLGKKKWEVSYVEEGGVVRTIKVKNFDEMAYRTIEAIVEIGRAPQLK